MSLAISLRNAVRLAIVNRNTLADIKIDRWAVTYGVTSQQVMAEWELAQSELSREPMNAWEENDG